jgi:DNA transposition AAA+ family ATPase
MSPAFASTSSALDRILTTALGYCQGMPGQGAATKHERIVDAIKRESVKVLLIDEAQELTPAAINAIRAIHDETGITIVLAGNPKVINQFYERKGRHGGLKPEFAQIRRRLNFEVELKEPCFGDVVALARHWDVHDPKAHAFLKGQAERGEGLGRMEGLIRIGRRLANNGAVTRQHLEEALEHMRSAI